MPLVGWICPNEGRTVGLHHFLGECPDPPFDEAWAAIILDTIAGDRLHVGATLTPTTLLACPRETIIKRFMDYNAKPTGFDTRQMGTAWHAVLAPVNAKLGWRSNVRLTDVDFPGIGPMSMEIDVLREDMKVIKDYKFTNQGTLSVVCNPAKYDDEDLKQGFARSGDNAQVGGFYRYFVEAYLDGKLEQGYIWYVAPLSGREKQRLGSGWIRRPVRFLDTREILQHKAGGGQFTVLEIADALKRAFARLKAGEDPATIVSEMPLYGLPMLGGTKCQQYCDVNHICAGLGGGAAVLAPYESGLARGQAKADPYRSFARGGK